MRLILLILLVVLSACQTRNSATGMSIAQNQWCENAGLSVNSEECKTYINAINQRTQQEHLLELKKQGVPVQYDECVKSLPIDTVYHLLSIKAGVSERNIRAFIPESTLNDFAKCTCSSMIYNGLMPEDAIQKCQTTTASNFLSQTKDIQLELCMKNTFDEIQQEYKRQNVSFEEKTLKDKYSTEVANYCNCVSETKEDIVHKYQYKPMSEKVQLAQKAATECAKNYLKLQ